MKQTPTLFQAPMVRAIVRDVDPKTITRRPVKGTALEWLEVHTSFTPEFVALQSNGLCPYGYTGDLLWVKETFYAWGRWETRFSAKKERDEWHFVDMTLESGKPYLYAADDLLGGGPKRPKVRGGIEPAYWKRPAIFMPRAASRITLEITGVRIERLQEISEADAIAEGIERSTYKDWWRSYQVLDPLAPTGFQSPIDSYLSLWKAINGAESLETNPWVWVVTFKRVTT